MRKRASTARHGHGIITSSGGYRYEGEFVDGQPRGFGTTTLVDSGRYDGPRRDSDFETFAATDIGSGATDIRGFRFGCELPDGRELKPAFGDIVGAFYGDLPAQRQQCLETIDLKIAFCRQNTDLKFELTNRKFADCLPIFEEQVRACVSHFEFERRKCDIGSSISDTATPDNGPIGVRVELKEQKIGSESSYTIEPLDRIMQVSEDANVRAGPGIGYGVLATLDAGAGVRVTGAVQGQEWLRVQPLERGGSAFVHMSLLKEAASALKEASSAPLKQSPKEAETNSLEPLSHQVTVAPLASPPEEDADAPLDSFGPNWSDTDIEHCQVWNYGEPELEPFTWVGACVDGKASGKGRLTFLGAVYVYEGTMSAGLMHGQGTIISSDGYRYQGGWDNGEPHGYGIESLASGERYEGEYRKGQRHGYGIYTADSGDVFEGDWRDGKPHGTGTYTNVDGSLFEGQWRDGCFGERDGEWATIGTTAQACGFQ